MDNEVIMNNIIRSELNKETNCLLKFDRILLKYTCKAGIFFILIF